MLLMSEVRMEKNMDEGVTSTNTEASGNDSGISKKPSAKVNDDGDGKSYNDAFTGASSSCYFSLKKLIRSYLLLFLLPTACILKPHNLTTTNCQHCWICVPISIFISRVLIVLLLYSLPCLSLQSHWKMNGDFVELRVGKTD